MRELVLDTETTGLDYENGDRIVEIGIIELENHIQTGNYFHYYLNPERPSSSEAFNVHRLTDEFLLDKPKFAEIANEFIEFISDSKVIIHNALFDLGFINSELKRCNIYEIDDNLIVDTLSLAKKRFAGQSVSLDALCRKYNIDISDRKIHGALKDAKLLSMVYLELIGGKQTKLEFNNEDEQLIDNNHEEFLDINVFYKFNEIIPENITNIDPFDHQLHLKHLKKIPNNIWNRIEN